MKIRRICSHDEVDCEPPLIGRSDYEKAVVFVDICVMIMCGVFYFLLGFLLKSFLLLYRNLVLGLVERFLERRLHSSGVSLGMPVGCICQEL